MKHFERPMDKRDKISIRNTLLMLNNGGKNENAIKKLCLTIIFTNAYVFKPKSALGCN